MTALVWPLPLDRLTSIGDPVMPDRGNGRPHKGVDLFAPARTLVSSAAPGRVLRVEDGRTAKVDSGRWLAGLWVDVLGPEGRVFRYLHLDEAHVKAGDELAAGAPVGVTAPSGTSGLGPKTPPHLHFEIRAGDYDSKRPKWHGKPGDEPGDYGTPIDPLALLPLQSSPRSASRVSQRPPDGSPDAAAAARAFLGSAPFPPARSSVLGQLAGRVAGALVVAAATRALWPRVRSALWGSEAS